jgi:hypothetical protein
MSAGQASWEELLCKGGGALAQWALETRLAQQKTLQAPCGMRTNG